MTNVPDWFRVILNSIFPPVCLGCRTHISSSEPLCPSCMHTLQAHATIRHNTLTPHIPATSVISYHDPLVQTLIHTAKYKHVPSAWDPLIQLCTQIGFKETGVWTIIPVPLHKRKYKQRGYNQAAYIASALYRILSHQPHQTCSFTYSETHLYKKYTEPQARITSPEERRKNIRGAFYISPPAPAQVILVDDVLTSGATTQEAARTLQDAGTTKLYVFTIASAT